MAYNKENKYKQMIQVQSVFKEHNKPGMSIEYIFREFIKNRFHISRRTFITYINTPAESNLNEILKKKAEMPKQMSFFEDEE